MTVVKCPRCSTRKHLSARRPNNKIMCLICGCQNDIKKWKENKNFDNGANLEKVYKHANKYQVK